MFSHSQEKNTLFSFYSEIYYFNHYASDRVLARAQHCNEANA